MPKTQTFRCFPREELEPDGALEPGGTFEPDDGTWT
jgi:hypothetical protein